MQPELTNAAYTKRLLDVQDRLFAYIVVFAPDQNFIVAKYKLFADRHALLDHEFDFAGREFAARIRR